MNYTQKTIKGTAFALLLALQQGSSCTDFFRALAAENIVEIFTEPNLTPYRESIRDTADAASKVLGTIWGVSNNDPRLYALCAAGFVMSYVGFSTLKMSVKDLLQKADEQKNDSTDTVQGYFKQSALFKKATLLSRKALCLGLKAAGIGFSTGLIASGALTIVGSKQILTLVDQCAIENLMRISALTN